MYTLATLVRRRVPAVHAACALLVLATLLAACSRSPNGPAHDGSATSLGPEELTTHLTTLPRLSFRSDGSFTIAQFSDLHLGSPNPIAADSGTFRLVRKIIDMEKPDLVVLTGDVSYMPAGHTRPRSWQMIVALLDGKAVPWAFVQGNHDSQYSGYARVDSLLATTRYGLYRVGPAGVTGHGNYVLPVYRRDGTSIGALIWCFDSGAYSTKPSGFGWVTASQVAWFKAESDLLVGSDGATTTGLAFFHIPLQQYPVEWLGRVCTGYRYKKTRVQEKDEGLYAAFQERSRVAACFVGHDHTNDYEGTLSGVDLCYGRYTGFGGYGVSGYQRGARVIKLAEGVRGYTSYIRQADGTLAARPVHQPTQPGLDPAPPAPPTPPAPIPTPTPTPSSVSFRSDGSFTIVQFSDLHLGTPKPTSTDSGTFRLGATAATVRRQRPSARRSSTTAGATPTNS